MMQLFDKVITTGNVRALLWLTAIAFAALSCHLIIEHFRKSIIDNISKIYPSTRNDDAPFFKIAFKNTAASFLDLIWLPLLVGLVFLLLPTAGFILFTAIFCEMLLLTTSWQRTAFDGSIDNTISPLQPIKLIRMISQLSILGSSAWFVSQGEISAGTMIALSLLSVRCLLPLEQLASHLPLLKQGYYDLKDYRKKLARIQKHQLNLPAFDPKRPIEVRNLAIKTAEDASPLLLGSNLILDPQKIYCITGGSSTGKTLFCDILAGKFTPLSGSVKYREINLQQWHLNAEATADLNSSFCYYIQQLYCPQKPSKDFITPILQDDELYDLAEQFDVLSLLTDTQNFTKRLENASFSEQKALEVLSCAVLNPWILIIDDPTQGFDLEQRKAFSSFLRHRKKNHCITVLSSQNPAMMAASDHIMMLQKNVPAKLLNPKDFIPSASKIATSSHIGTLPVAKFKTS